MKEAFAGPLGLERLTGVVDPLTTSGAFSARMHSVRAAHLVITYVAVSPCRINQSKDAAAQSQQLHMIFPLDCPVHAQGQLPCVVQPGGVIVGASASLPPLQIDTAGRALIISSLPGSRPATMFAPSENTYFTSPPSSTLAVARAAADALFRSPAHSARTIGILTQICSAVVVDAYLDSKHANGVGTLTAKAHRLIADRFKEANCTPQEIAREMGVSLRKLQDAFWREGGVATTIRAHRTQEALRLLESAGTKLHLESIAQHSGFKDIGAMRRAMAKNIGVLPSAYRKHFG